MDLKVILSPCTPRNQTQRLHMIMASSRGLCGEACIDNVVVAERYRNRGVAQAMLGELIARGESDQVEAFTLDSVST